jgi:hypothetical protein
MEDTEVTETDRELTVRSHSAIEHQAMAGTVHRLHSETLTLDLEEIDVVLIILIVTRSFPEL